MPILRSPIPLLFRPIALPVLSRVATFYSKMASPPSKITPLLRSLYPATIVYTPQDLRRQDEGSDTAWYAQPRFVQHIDDGAIESLKAYYDAIIKPNHSIVDLCSSWTSHLSMNLKPQTMIGYGMNKLELERNAHLTKYFVKDLNTNPSLEEVPSESVDTVICNVSVDYLTQPVSIFKEMNRVLKVGGIAHMASTLR